MKKITIVKVGFCKTFGVNIVLNVIITSYVSNQMRWLDGEINGFKSWQKLPCGQWCILTK